jgi:hypothetical protein
MQETPDEVNAFHSLPERDPRLRPVPAYYRSHNPRYAGILPLAPSLFKRKVAALAPHFGVWRN